LWLSAESWNTIFVKDEFGMRNLKEKGKGE
jgi:hypothetical protein